MTAPRKALPAIDTTRCTGCGWCVAVCAPHVLSLQVQGDSKVWGPKRSELHDAAGCTGCALCAVRCPFDAIRMVRAGVAPGSHGGLQAVGDEAALSHTRGDVPVV
jgi:ferredoxin